MNSFLPNPRMDGETGQAHNTKNDLSGRRFAQLSIAALGVVFGDIGTSPLYAIRECFHGVHGIAVSSANVLGVLSLMFWSLLMIVTFKYLIFVMQAGNQGEGGVMVLTALIKSATGPVILVWFIVLAALGFIQIVRSPQVLAALLPWYGIQFLLINKFHGFIVLGAVFLVATGAEALYADMGHGFRL